MMVPTAGRKGNSGSVFVAVGALLVLAGLFLFPGRAAALDAHDFKMAGDATHTRVVINFDKEPEPRWFMLRGPHRLVVDLPKTRFAIDPKELKASRLVTNVRYGDLSGESSRLIFEVKGPFVI